MTTKETLGGDNGIVYWASLHCHAFYIVSGKEIILQSISLRRSIEIRTKKKASNDELKRTPGMQVCAPFLRLITTN